MSILEAILGRFARYPKYDVSGYRAIYTAVVSRLTREGVTVGGTAFVPRVEVHTIREQARIDKDGALREVNLIVESISNKSLDEAVTMNDDNLQLLTESGLTTGDGWAVVGVVPVQLQDMTEASDTNKIIYRLLQDVTIFLERVKSDTPPPPAPDPEDEDDTEDENN